MSAFVRLHHQCIVRALKNFNIEFMVANNILFGGGTRIALEINEFRESVDIDFICIDVIAYREVREQVTNCSLGNLAVEDFYYPREIRVDRDAVRCFIQLGQTVIKLEIVRFVDYRLQAQESRPFSVPMLDRSSCFITKLLANVDCYRDMPYKDIFDILAMVDAWGNIPELAWLEAKRIYGKQVVLQGLMTALNKIMADTNKYYEIAINSLNIEPATASYLIEKVCPELRESSLAIDLKQ